MYALYMKNKPTTRARTPKPMAHPSMTLVVLSGTVSLACKCMAEEKVGGLFYLAEEYRIFYDCRLATASNRNADSLDGLLPAELY